MRMSNGMMKFMEMFIWSERVFAWFLAVLLLEVFAGLGLFLYGIGKQYFGW